MMDMAKPIGAINVQIIHNGQGWVLDWVGAESHVRMQETTAHMSNYITTLLAQHLVALQAGAMARKTPGASSPGTQSPSGSGGEPAPPGASVP